MLNNLEIIKPLLIFDNEDDFYYLQILKRKKDQSPEEKALGRNNNARCIKEYYINSIKYLEDKMPEIINLCTLFNARASIRLNKRSYKKVAFRTLQKIADTIVNGEYSHLKNSYSKACGTGHNAGKNKTWILDWDGTFTDTDKAVLEEYIRDMRPSTFNSKVKAYIPSNFGMHIITNPFDLREWKNHFPEVEIHKDNPTNLYIP